MDFRGGKRWTTAQWTCRCLSDAAKRANANWTGWQTHESKLCTKWALVWYDYFFITLDENLCISDVTQVYAVEGEREYIVNVKGKNSVILDPGLLTWWHDIWTELYTSKNSLSGKSSMKMSPCLIKKKVLMISICYESENLDLGQAPLRLERLPLLGPLLLAGSPKLPTVLFFNKLRIYVCTTIYKLV